MPWVLRDAGAFLAAATEFSDARIRYRDTARELGAKAATLAAAVAGEAIAANVKFAARADFTAFYLNLVFSVAELERAYDAVELLGFRVLSTPAAARQGKKAPPEESAAVNVARARLGYLWQLMRKGHAALCTAPAAEGGPELQGSDEWELSQLVVAGAGAAAGGDGERGGGEGAAAHAAAEAGGEGRAAAHAAAEAGGSGADSEAELSEGKRAAERAQADGGGGGSGSDAEEEGGAAAGGGGHHSDDEGDENCDIKVLPAGAKRALSPPASPAPQLQQPLAKRASRTARGSAASGGGGGGGGAAAAGARYPRGFRDISAAGDVSSSSSSSRSSSRSSSSSGSSSASSLPSSPAAGARRAAAVAYAAKREKQLDAAAAAAVDQPLVQKMAAAGAPVPLAVRALALAREAIGSLDPGAGLHYVRGLKNSIKGLAEQLVEARDRVAYLENQCKMWRDAAMGKGGGEGEGGGEKK